MLLQEECVLRGQELENAIIDANYIKAIQIAFELRRPRKLFELFEEIYRFLNFNLLPAPLPFTFLSLFGIVSLIFHCS